MSDVESGSPASWSSSAGNPTGDDSAHQRVSRSTRLNRFGRRAVRGLGLLTGIAGLTALVARSVTATSQVLVILACAVPVLTATTLLGVVLMGALRLWVLFAMNVVVALTLTVIQLPAYVSHAATLDPLGTVRMLSGNLRLGQANAADLVGLARSRKVQVVALQELTVEEVDRLKASGIDEEFPYSILSPAPNASGVGLWSSIPITQATQHWGFSFRLVSGVIDVGQGRTVTFFSSHMDAPWPQAPYGWVDDLTNLGKLLNSTSGPVVDAGDFNATTDNAQFRHLLSVSHTKDAADESGSAPTFSYPADISYVPPLIAIDHVLVRTVAAHSVKTVSLPGSDHRGLVSVVGFRA